ncbi:MAG TPA: helix-turn-helix domain-containing protein [Nocardioidaceae bacterium]|nr:helix-turn-helix domain-containing protein [Nocardioidaceae bacterium]
MPLSRRRVTAAADLKALAHPLRMAILGALVTEGPMTASELGRLLEESPSNCSWHLRKLADHGFVREASGGHGRNRPWKAVSEGLVWGEGDEDSAASAAADALTDLMMEREVQRLRAARASRDQEPAEWRDATGLSQAAMWLTADEAKQLLARQRELFLTHAERMRDPSSRPDGARLMTMVGWLVPSGPHKLPRTESAAHPEEQSP